MAPLLGATAEGLEALARGLKHTETCLGDVGEGVLWAPR